MAVGTRNYCHGFGSSAQGLDSGCEEVGLWDRLHVATLLWVLIVTVGRTQISGVVEDPGWPTGGGVQATNVNSPGGEG